MEATGINNTRHDFTLMTERKTKDTLGRQYYKMDRFKWRSLASISWRQNKMVDNCPWLWRSQPSDHRWLKTW